MQLRGVLAVVWLCVGCGGSMTSPPPKPPSVASGLAIADAGSIPLELGERLVAEAEVLGMSIGTLDMRLTKPCDAASEGQWIIDSKLGTAGILSWFNKTQGHTSTVLDPATLRPIRSTTLVLDGGAWRRYELSFGPGTYSYRYEKSSGEKKTGEGASPEHEPIHDTQTAYVLLRSWQPKPKEQSYFYVVLGKDLWRADVKFRGEERIEFEDEKISVLHVEGKAHRIDLGPGDEYSPRSFSLWLTNDERRLPVKVVGDGSLGSVHFNLDERSVGEVCRDVAAGEMPKVETPERLAAGDVAGVSAAGPSAEPSEEVAAAKPVSAPPEDAPSSNAAPSNPAPSNAVPSDGASSEADSSRAAPGNAGAPSSAPAKATPQGE